MSDGEPGQDKKELPNKDASAPTSASGSATGEPPASGASGASSDGDEPEQDVDSSPGVLAEQRPPDDS